MNKILTVVLGVIWTFSFANDHMLIEKQQDHNPLIKIKINDLVSRLIPCEVLTIQMAGIANNSHKSGQFSLISKTISFFGTGFNMAGFNVQMNKLNLMKGSGWVHKKECNLHVDEVNNGLTIKYQF